MENEVTRYDDDTYEIDLIDLFAVLLRYRKMIILGTLLVTFLTGAFLFLKPKVLPKSEKKDLKVTYVIKTQGFSSSISSGLSRLGANLSLGGDLVNSFEDYPILAKEYKTYPVLGEDYPEDILEYNKMITTIFQNKIGKRKEDIKKDSKITMEKSIGNSYYLECSLPAERYETKVLDDFIKEHLAAVNQRFQERADEYLVTLENKTLESYKEIKAQNTTASATTIGRADTEQSLRETLQDLQSYKENPITFYEIKDEPFVIPDETKSKSKSIIIAFFASFFCFVCLAFAIHVIGNIKNNKEMMDKISIAWKEGK